jgi:hypothetical protein
MSFRGMFLARSLEQTPSIEQLLPVLLQPCFQADLRGISGRDVLAELCDQGCRRSKLDAIALKFVKGLALSGLRVRLRDAGCIHGYSRFGLELRERVAGHRLRRLP